VVVVVVVVVVVAAAVVVASLHARILKRIVFAAGACRDGP
jgi:hypothetical protein